MTTTNTPPSIITEKPQRLSVQKIFSMLLTFGRKPIPASRAGMGAIPHDQGTTFRVWAPHASSVCVTGTFNRWNQMANPLLSEGDGYWSADVRNAQPGDEYKFALYRDHTVLIRTDPYAFDVSDNYQNSVITDLSETDWDVPFSSPKRHELVIYELHVGTFHEQKGTPPGTFQGVIDKLPYLKQLGFNCIQLMPIANFAGRLSWGYNPANPFAITRVYGGWRGFRSLVRAAHQQGIAVIVDVVYNHFGPDNLSLWQFDGWSENGLGGIYFYNDWRAQTPWGHTRPDYGRPAVRNYLMDNVRMWLETFRVDGLRWDATNYIRTAGGFNGGGDIPEGWSLMQEINGMIEQKYPEKFCIAEDLQTNRHLTIGSAYGGAGFASQWDAQFVHAIRSALISPADEYRNVDAVTHALAYRYNEDVFDRVIYTESHDEVANGKARVPEEIAPGDADSIFAKKRATLGAGLVFTAPGIPMIFQGQEFLEDSWFRDDDPLDWDKMRQNQGLVMLYRDLVRLRRNLRGVTAGLMGQNIHVYHTNPQEKLVVFHRWLQGGAGDDVVVVANFANVQYNNYRIGFPCPGFWRMRFNSDFRAYDREFSDDLVGDIPAEEQDYDGLPYSGLIEIAPYSLVIFSQDGVKSGSGNLP